MSAPFLEERAGSVRITVYAQPRASKSEIVGLHDGALKVRVAAPPVEGEANEELTRFFAKWLGLPRSSVQLARGAASRHKIVEISGVTAAAIHDKLKADGIPV